MGERGRGLWARWCEGVARIPRRVMFFGCLVSIATGLALMQRLSSPDRVLGGAGYTTTYWFDLGRPPVPLSISGSNSPDSDGGTSQAEVYFSWNKHGEFFRSVETIGVNIRPMPTFMHPQRQSFTITPSDVDLLRPFIADWLRRERGAGPKTTGDAAIDLSDEVADLIASGRASMTRTDWPGTRVKLGRVFATMLMVVPVALTLSRSFVRERYVRGLGNLASGKCPHCGYPVVRSSSRAERCPECGTEFDGWRVEAERVLR